MTMRMTYLRLESSRTHTYTSSICQYGTGAAIGPMGYKKGQNKIAPLIVNLLLQMKGKLSLRV